MFVRAYRPLVVALVGLLVGLLVAALAAAIGPLGPAHAADETPEVTPLPVGTDADYQLGGPRSVPDNVGIVVRDRSAEPVPGRYGVCYVNAFQTQPDERGFWRDRQWLLLRKNGHVVVDEAWGERLLNLRSSRKRRALARIVGRWMAGCAEAGYDAVELDNLDSFTRSRGRLSRRQALAYARMLVDRAHAEGLAVGQKNLAGYDGTRIGFDFAVAEECGRWRECGEYTRAYGRRVVAVEYRARDFRWTCRRFSRLPVVQRDLDLSPDGVRRFC